MSDDLISAGYLPCMTLTSCETTVKKTKLPPLNINTEEYKYPSDMDLDTDDDNAESIPQKIKHYPKTKDEKSIQKTKEKDMSLVSAIIEYVSNIKGL
jgi:hypothetical protein